MIFIFFAVKDDVRVGRFGGLKFDRSPPRAPTACRFRHAPTLRIGDIVAAPQVPGGARFGSDWPLVAVA
jgi:hypothetical protein